jgi:NAD(P)-dependent dehydrogenase (short-subunit alcohol dehydrogenase family)
MKILLLLELVEELGLELALQFAKAGHQVLAISRNIPQLY